MSKTAKPAACFAPKAQPPEPPMSKMAKPAACSAPKALPPAQPPGADQDQDPDPERRRSRRLARPPVRSGT
jgi:hypothetical protein